MAAIEDKARDLDENSINQYLLDTLRQMLPDFHISRENKKVKCQQIIRGIKGRFFNRIFEVNDYSELAGASVMEIKEVHCLDRGAGEDKKVAVANDKFQLIANMTKTAPEMAYQAVSSCT